MSIVSFQFLVFAVCVVLLYFIVPRKWQWIVLLTANIVFYAFSGKRYLIYVLITAAVTYWAAVKLEACSMIGTSLISVADSAELKKEIKGNILSIRKTICGIAIVIGMGAWAVLKYSNFFIRNINRFLSLVGREPTLQKIDWVLPLGISFYSFHAVGYLVDVYRGKYPAEKNFLKYFTFITYFPHIIQGPFSRYDLLGESMLKEHRFSYERLCHGCARILWGVYKKLVVADKLGIAVNTIFADYKNYSGVHLIFAIFGYCVELYADFSGYMDIVCGISNILGIDLAENFKQPYFARSVDEFWRRWHITLGKWFKDYVFYPVSMGKVGQKLGKWARKKWGAKMGKLLPGYFALIFVWTATGLWHGASWTYIVWGYLNLLAIMLSMQLVDFNENIKNKLHIKSENWVWQVFAIVRTFILLCFFRFFAIANSLREACSMLKHMFLNLSLNVLGNPMSFFVNMSLVEIYAVLLGGCLILVVDIFNEIGKWQKIKENCPMIIRNLVFTFLVFTIMLIAGGDNDLAGGFMYANF